MKRRIYLAIFITCICLVLTGCQHKKQVMGMDVLYASHVSDDDAEVNDEKGYMLALRNIKGNKCEDLSEERIVKILKKIDFTKKYDATLIFFMPNKYTTKIENLTKEEAAEKLFSDCEYFLIAMVKDDEAVCYLKMSADGKGLSMENIGNELMNMGRIPMDRFES